VRFAGEPDPEYYYVQAFLPNGLSWTVAANLQRVEAEDRARRTAFSQSSELVRAEVRRDYGWPRRAGLPQEDPVVATFERVGGSLDSDTAVV